MAIVACPDMLSATDDRAANRTLQAMMAMKKIDAHGSDDAFAGKDA